MMRTRKRKQASKLPVLILCAVILAAGAGGGVYYVSAHREGSFLFDDAAVDGNLEGMSEREIRALMQNKVDESMLAISINTSPEFPDGVSKGTLRIENNAANRYNMTVAIVRDDTGETIYQSAGIRPGQMIEEDELDVNLEKGDYPCTATFTAYETEKNTPMGEAAAKLTIRVKG